MTRLGGPKAPPALAKLLPALLGSLRGTICLYQGEELGLPEAELAFEDLRDPVGIAFYPEAAGRDGCRTPMPWAQAGPFGGFSAVKPWLPMPAAHLPLAVDRQEGDPGSVLSSTRRFLLWRRAQPALIRGGARFVEAPEPILALLREHGDDALLCVFNLGPEAVDFRSPAAVAPLEGHGFAAGFEDGVIKLPGYGAFFGRRPKNA